MAVQSQLENPGSLILSSLNCLDTQFTPAGEAQGPVWPEQSNL